MFQPLPVPFCSTVMLVCITLSCNRVAFCEPLGISLQSDRGGVYVTKVVPDSPASRCASSLLGHEGSWPLRPGDRILSVDGLHVTNHEVAAARLRRGGDVLQAIVKQRGSDTVRPVVICRNGAAPTPERHLSEHDRIVWALLVADTLDQKIGTGCMASLARMENLLLGSGIPLNRVAVFHQYNNNFTPDRLREAIKQIGSLVRPQDTFIVYLNGHGAMDPRIVAYARKLGEPLPNALYWGAFINMRGGDLLRQDASLLLRKQPGRLKVFITDTCLSVGEARLAEQNRLPKEDNTGIEQEGVAICRTVERVGVSRLESLLLHSVGDADFASCGFGQTSSTRAPDWDVVRRMTAEKWDEYLSSSGAFFTSSLCDALVNEAGCGDTSYGMQEWFNDAKANTIRLDVATRLPGERQEAQVPIMRSIKGWASDGTVPPSRRWTYVDGLQDDAVN